MAGLSRNSSHLCVNPAEWKKWLTCLSVISTLLDDTRSWLELPQIQTSLLYRCWHWLCVCRWSPASLDIRLGSLVCRLLHASWLQPSTPGHSVPLSPLWRNRLDLRAPPHPLVFLTPPARSRGQRHGQPCRCFQFPGPFLAPLV